MAKDTRFKIRSREGVQHVKHDAALSLAITQATRQDAKPGVWTVLEWDEETHRLTRHDNGDVIIEVLV